MGILKKSGSWLTSKREKHVKFGFEKYSTREMQKPAKFCDGLSNQGYAWNTFIKMLFEYDYSPQNAWDCIPSRYSSYVWEVLLEALDRYLIHSRFMSNPRGKRTNYYCIDERYYWKVFQLGNWVNSCIIKYGYKDLVKSSKRKLLSYVDPLDEREMFMEEKYYDENKYFDEFDNIEWDYLKNNCSRQPFAELE